MTGLAAEHMGLADRGTIRPGMAADLVLFDADTVLDRATTGNPHAPSDGILRVMVAGETVYKEGRTAGSRPGRVLRRTASPRAAASRPATPPAAAA
jgi:N-acyl-D-amino-acid deacylase